MKKYGFDYGDDKCMNYLYPCGIVKVLELIKSDKKFKLDQETYNMIITGVRKVPKQIKKTKEISGISEKVSSKNPIQITVVLKG